MLSQRRKVKSPGRPQDKAEVIITAPVRKPKQAAARASAQSASSPSANKRHRCLDLLARRDGAILSELVAATDWQPHSVRGFLSGIVKKKLGLTLHVSSDDTGTRRYRIDRKDRRRG